MLSYLDAAMAMPSWWCNILRFNIVGVAWLLN